MISSYSRHTAIWCMVSEILKNFNWRTSTLSLTWTKKILVTLQLHCREKRFSRTYHLAQVGTSSALWKQNLWKWRQGVPLVGFFLRRAMTERARSEIDERDTIYVVQLWFKTCLVQLNQKKYCLLIEYGTAVEVVKFLKCDQFITPLLLYRSHVEGFGD